MHSQLDGPYVELLRGSRLIMHNYFLMQSFDWEDVSSDTEEEEDSFDDDALPRVVVSKEEDNMLFDLDEVSPGKPLQAMYVLVPSRLIIQQGVVSVQGCWILAQQRLTYGF